MTLSGGNCFYNYSLISLVNNFRKITGKSQIYITISAFADFYNLNIFDLTSFASVLVGIKNIILRGGVVKGKEINILRWSGRGGMCVTK